jgi:hypothetical protein
MSQVAHAHLPVRQQLLRDARRARIVALAAITTLAALVVALVLALGNGGSPAASSEQDSVQGVAPVGGLRYDGGPEEGAPGTIHQPTQQPGIRYDGGPEEGQRSLTGPPGLGF